MAVLRVRSALGVTLAGTLLALTGCADTAPVSAPAFVVPSPPPLSTGGGGTGTAQQASDTLSDWVHSLYLAHFSKGYRTHQEACHGDAPCLALVRQARALPYRPGQGVRPVAWSMELDDVMRADPAHHGSWTQVIRPYWRADSLPYGGHDGWASATMLRVRMTATRSHTGDVDWRIRLSAVPSAALDPIPLDHPVLTRIGP